ncbi:hypothetical protein DFH28DRAFT_1133266 [Melampsora americana]|nr:hypothetical protein DFH28DRAFT_1133266 [Melampsora americana]
MEPSLQSLTQIHNNNEEGRESQHTNYEDLDTSAMPPNHQQATSAQTFNGYRVPQSPLSGSELQADNLQLRLEMNKILKELTQLKAAMNNPSANNSEAQPIKMIVSSSSEEEEEECRRRRRPPRISHNFSFKLGDNIDEFLQLYEEQADIDNVGSLDKAKQVISFFEGDFLREDIREMKGYGVKKWNWKILKKELRAKYRSFRFPPKHSMQELRVLSHRYIRSGGISSKLEYESFKMNFEKIYNYLYKYDRIDSKVEVAKCFYESFSYELQKQLKKNLVKNNLIMFASDGSAKLPKISVLKEVAAELFESQVLFSFEEVTGDKLVVVDEVKEVKSEISKSINSIQSVKNQGSRMKAQLKTEIPGLCDQMASLKINNIILNNKFKLQEASSFPDKPKLQYKSVLPAPVNNNYKNYSHSTSMQPLPVSHSNIQPQNSPLVCYYCGQRGHSTQRCSKVIEDLDRGWIEIRDGFMFLRGSQEKLKRPSDGRPIREYVLMVQDKKLCSPQSQPNPSPPSFPLSSAPHNTQEASPSSFNTSQQKNVSNHSSTIIHSPNSTQPNNNSTCGILEPWTMSSGRTSANQVLLAGIGTQVYDSDDTIRETNQKNDEKNQHQQNSTTEYEEDYGTQDKKESFQDRNSLHFTDKYSNFHASIKLTDDTEISKNVVMKENQEDRHFL